MNFPKNEFQIIKALKISRPEAVITEKQTKEKGRDGETNGSFWRILSLAVHSLPILLSSIYHLLFTSCLSSSLTHSLLFLSLYHSSHLDASFTLTVTSGLKMMNRTPKWQRCPFGLATNRVSPKAHTHMTAPVAWKLRGLRGLPGNDLLRRSVRPLEPLLPFASLHGSKDQQGWPACNQRSSSGLVCL